MVLDIKNLYNIVSLVLTVLFSFYLIFNNTKDRSGNIYIGLFILCMGLGNLDFLVARTSFYNENPDFFLWLSFASFLFFPLMFFYIRSVAYKGYQLKWYDIFHAIPLVLVIIVSFFEYHSQSTDFQIKMMTTTDSFKTWWIRGLYILLRVQAFLYLYLSIRIVLRFRQIVKENYSGTNKRNYKWILHLTFVFVYIVISGSIHNFLLFVVDEPYEETVFYVIAPINIAFLIWLIYKALSQPYLFNGVDANIKLLEEYLKENEKQQKEAGVDTLDDSFNSQNSELKIKLEEYMETQEPYLNPSLTLYELAKGLDLSTLELSVFLNKQLNRTFFDFINEYRINKAKEMLADPKNNKITVLEILYDVGFNSKSSFNTAFKKNTGLTPTGYRKKHVLSTD